MKHAIIQLGFGSMAMRWEQLKMMKITEIIKGHAEILKSFRIKRFSYIHF